MVRTRFFFYTNNNNDIQVVGLVNVDLGTFVHCSRKLTSCHIYSALNNDSRGLQKKIVSRYRYVPIVSTLQMYNRTYTCVCQQDTDIYVIVFDMTYVSTFKESIQNFNRYIILRIYIYLYRYLISKILANQTLFGQVSCLSQGCQCCHHF